VPSQHQHGETQNTGVEDFLAVATEQLRQAAGKHRHHACAKHAGGDAARNPRRTTGHACRNSHDDADYQARFEDFTKDNDKSCKHRRLTQQAIWVDGERRRSSLLSR
jgi:hypothetical protein